MNHTARDAKNGVQYVIAPCYGQGVISEKMKLVVHVENGGSPGRAYTIEPQQLTEALKQAGLIPASTGTRRDQPTQKRPLLTNYYQNLIHWIDPSINPAGVEAIMRIEHTTLDHLPRSAFEQAVKLAREREALEPGYMREAADYCSLIIHFEDWETILSRTALHGETPPEQG